MIQRILRRLVRTSAFVGKEVNEVRRQPRLILSLILGPFLILFLFGAGYQVQPLLLSAMVVVPKDGGYSLKTEDYTNLTGGQLNIVGVTTDQVSALQTLQDRQVDLVVVIPQNIGEQISAGSQVPVPMYFNQIDPLRRDTITYLTYFYINEINKHTVAEAARQGQQNAQDVHTTILRLRNALNTVDQQMQRNETQQAAQQVQSMQGSTGNIQIAMAVLSQLTASDSTLLKSSQSTASPQQANLAQSQQVANKLSGDLQSLNDELSQPNPDNSQVRQRVEAVRGDLDKLDSLTQQFQKINPLVLAAPFYADPQNKAPIKTSYTNFFSPGVLALLLQHIGVTLGSLSMVRERLLGTVELFRVSPTRPAEIMVGKYISFLLMLGVVAAVLLLLMSNDLTIGGFQLSLGVPILGSWALLVLSLALLVFASVGLGFLISTLSKSESQAVQLSMLVLLTSVFFSGFFLRIESLWAPVQAVSYALPVTYGIKALQEVMLRGDTPAPALLLALLMLGAFFGLLSYMLFNRQYQRG